MSFKCQILKTRLTFNNNVFVKYCDVRLIIILCVISAILPIIRCAKLKNPQIRLLINDDDLLQEKTNIHEASSAADPVPHDNSGEHFNLYRSELKRLSYETIHRILRDENEPSYRREETELRYYQKRSPSFEENHQLIKRSAKEKPLELNLSRKNFTEFLITPQIHQRLSLVSLLDLSYNHLKQLNISLLNNITSLNSLNLQNNKFTRILLGQESTLKTLNLNNNLIRTSDLSPNIYLRSLHLAGNRIESLSSLKLALLKNLETLDVSHNLLQNSDSSFFTERMHNLKHLNLAFNQLSSIYRESFYNLLSLNTLLLSHNNISDIDYETFLALPNLQFLDLSFNNLQGKSIRALQGITGLVALNIAFNPDIGPYMQEFVASWSLKELDASGTGLCQIPAALAQSVRSLKLTHNWLKVINCGDLDSYPLLQYLDLSFSHVEHIEDDALGRLEILEVLMLDHNKLHKVPFSLPVSLEHLFLQNNELMDIPQQAFQGLTNLKTLDLSNNKLLYLPDIMLPKLQTLNLQSSEIRGISQGIIHSLPKLNDLMLEDNPIKCADLLGIAEWASTCRLRMEKEDGPEQAAEEGEEDNFVIRIKDLKNKFEKMHNFYEQFGLNTSFVNDTSLKYLKEPSCVEDIPNALAQVQKPSSQEEEDGKIFKSSHALNETLKQNKFNLSSMTSRPVKNNSEERVAKKEHSVREVKQQKRKEFEDENIVKEFNIEISTQTPTATINSSNLGEKQQTSYANVATASNVVAIAKDNNDSKIQNATKEKPKIPSDVKTLPTVAANASGENQQDKATVIGNGTSNSYSNEDATRLARILKANEAFNETGGRELMQLKPGVAVDRKDESHSGFLDLNLNKYGNGKQFIKSTTLATSINSANQTTTTASPPPITSGATAAAIATTTMAEASIHIEQEGKLDNASSGRGEFEEKVGNVFGFERTTSNLEINLETDKQQHQHETKTTSATTKEIKSLETKNLKTMQSKIFETATKIPTTLRPTANITTNITMAKRTFQIPPKLTANLDKHRKEINGAPTTTTPTTTTPADDILTTNSVHINTTTVGHKPAIQAKHELATTTSIAAATFNTIEQEKPTTTINSLVKDKDLASNYNDDNENKRQTTEAINKTSNNTAKTTTPASSSRSTSTNNKNIHVAKTFDITTTAQETAVTPNIVDQQHQQQPSNLLQDVKMSHYRQFLQKDVIVKCTQSNSNECISVAATATHRPDEFGRTPTIEATLEQTTASETSTEIPEAAVNASTTSLTHKHEPLQLLVKDRHLIGTPLLMHKGENLMVTADELILPTNNHNTEPEESNNNSSNSNSKEHYNLETDSIANDNKYKPHLATSQTTKLSAAAATTTTATTEATPKSHIKDEYEIEKPIAKNTKEKEKLTAAIVSQEDLGKIKKSTDETKTKNPSLIMRKMTIITKQHEEAQPVHSAEPLENETHAKQFDNSHYQELKPLAANLEEKVDQTHTLKHSTVNKPIIGNNQDTRQPANLLKQPHTFQHEHELLMQQILQDQQVETHSKLTKSEQWSDLRKAESKENHPGLILLVSSGLFLVLLIGLMHVYRCDMPWRRHVSSHHLRPHQRQNHSFEDDSHSFLSYSEGMQKWHHSTRLEAPYNSPLHNLHVRELQKTSATEKPATVKSSIKNFKPPILSRSIALESSRSLSQSSTTTTTTSTASASSSAILDDESFYIEMTPDSGQLTRALQSELLPMELLNMNQTQTLDHQDTTVDSQTSMEDECIVHYQQQQRHLPHLLASTSASSASPAIQSALSSTCSSVKPQSQSRRFRLW